MRGNGERWEDRKDYPKHAKRNLQEHSTFLKSIFGEKNTPKIHILCQKSDFFRQKYFLAKAFQFLAEFLANHKEVIL